MSRATPVPWPAWAAAEGVICAACRQPLLEGEPVVCVGRAAGTSFFYHGACH